MAKVLKILGALFGVLVGAVAVFIVTFDINSWKGWLEKQATAALGRDVAVAGPLDIAWSWTPRVTVEGLSVANVDWAEKSTFAKFEKLDFTIKLWPLIQGRTEFPDINLIEPELFLQRNENEQVNWSFGEGSSETSSPDSTVDDAAEQTAKEAATPDDRSEFPIIGRLTVEDGLFQFLDETQNIDLTGDINTVAGSGGDGDQVEIGAEGELEDQDFSIQLQAGPLVKLRNSDEPYPVDLDVTLGKTEASIDGTLSRPLDLAGLDLKLTISGDDMAKAFPITGIPTFSTPPYRFSGDVHGEGDLWRVTQLDGKLGGSDIKGDVEVDLGQDPLRFDIDLTSEKFDFVDLGTAIGAQDGDDSGETEDEGIIPDQEIDLERLSAANGKLRIRSKEVIAPGLPINDLDLALELEDSVLRFEPANFGVADGTVNLWMSLYGNQQPVQVDILTRIRNVQLKEAIRGSQFVQETGGSIDGRIQLSGRGQSIRQILDSADGTSYLVMTDGDISALIIEAIGLDIGEGLGLYFGDDTNVPINCLATDLEVDDGIAETKLAVLDTNDTLIEMTGQADLGEEQLDLAITPHPKDVSLLNFRSKVLVEGPFTEPDISLDGSSILKNVPLIDLGLAENAPCDKLIARARDDNS